MGRYWEQFFLRIPAVVFYGNIVATLGLKVAFHSGVAVHPEPVEGSQSVHLSAHYLSFSHCMHILFCCFELLNSEQSVQESRQGGNYAYWQP